MITGLTMSTKHVRQTMLVEDAPPVNTPRIPPVNDWTFGAPRQEGEVTIHGLTYSGGGIAIVIDNTYAPFELGSMDVTNSRKTLTLRLPEHMDEPLACVEAALVHEVAIRSTDFFGRSLSEEQIGAMYKAITKKNGPYPRHIRAKVNTIGGHRTRYWDASRAHTEPPASHAGMTFKARLQLRALWIGAEAWGVVCDATDLQLQETVIGDCPF